MDQTPGSDTNATTVLEHETWDYYRSYFYDGKLNASQKVSEWYNLTKDEHYFMKSKHVNYDGKSHFTVAVEIETNNGTNHSQAMKEIQQLSMMPNQTLEKTRITVGPNIDGKDYYLNF